MPIPTAVPSGPRPSLGSQASVAGRSGVGDPCDPFLQAGLCRAVPCHSLLPFPAVLLMFYQQWRPPHHLALSIFNALKVVAGHFVLKVIRAASVQASYPSLLFLIRDFPRTRLWHKNNSPPNCLLPGDILPPGTRTVFCFSES